MKGFNVKAYWVKKNRLQKQPILKVTPAGFKPATAGAEIQCAIQLRHEAIWSKIIIYCNNNIFFT